MFSGWPNSTNLSVRSSVCLSPNLWTRYILTGISALAKTDSAWCFVSLNISLSHSRTLKIIDNDTIRKFGYGFLFAYAFHSNYRYSSILYHFRNKASRKSRFFISLVFDAPVRRSLSEYCHTVWCLKTRMMWLPDGEKIWLYLVILTQYRRVTNSRHANVWKEKCVLITAGSRPEGPSFEARKIEKMGSGGVLGAVNHLPTS